MTDRINSLVVVLDHDYREDDTEQLVAAIRQLRGVIEVRHGEAANAGHIIAKAQARGEMVAKIGKVLEDYV